MTNFDKRVIAPDPKTVNTYCSPARISTMYSYLGKPKMPLGSDCNSAKISPKIKDKIETRRVGPIELTGFKPFLDVLDGVFEKVKVGNPDLYLAIGSAGCLCVRYVRGSTTQPSNHSWGTALDVKMLNPTTGHQVLDPRGDGKIQVGCLELYKYFKQHGLETGDWCFWGVGFPTEDGMHFEASDELIRKWAANKLI